MRCTTTSLRRQRQSPPSVTPRAIADYCQSLATFPERGPARDDIRQGLRITHYRRRTIIAYQLDAATDRVVIHGIYYGGQDFEADAALQRPV